MYTGIVEYELMCTPFRNNRVAGVGLNHGWVAILDIEANDILSWKKTSDEGGAVKCK